MFDEIDEQFGVDACNIEYNGFTNKINEVVGDDMQVLRNVPQAPGLHNVLESQALDKIKSRCQVSYENGNKLIIPEILTVEQQNLLLSSYQKYNLMFINKDNNDHAFAAASRRCEEIHLLKKASYTFGKEYEQVIVTDIGGNFAKNFVRDASGIHHCSPVLDKIDANRKTNRMNLMLDYVRDNKLTNKQKNFYKQIKNIFDSKVRETEFICVNKIQDCTVKTRYGIALHSLYDIKPKQLCEGMVRKEMTTVYASMMWDPTIVYAKSGYLKDLNVCWEIYSDEINNQRIRFAFKGDSSICYDHKLSTYLSWFMATTVITKNSTHFIIEPLESMLGISYFRVNKIDMSGIKNDTLINIRRWTNLEDKIVIRWQLSYVESFIPKFARKLENSYAKFMKWNYGEDKWYKMSQSHTFSTESSYEKILEEGRRSKFGSKFQEIAFLVKKDTVQQILSFILGTAEKKFCQPECFNYARSKCYAIMVGKDIVSSGDQMDSRLLFLLSQVLYVYAWMLKYNHGIDMSNYMKAVGENRRLADASFFGKWFVKTTDGRLRRIFTSPIRRVNEYTYHYLKNKSHCIQNIISEAPAYYDLNNKGFECFDVNWNSENLESLSTIPNLGVFQNYPSLVEDIVNNTHVIRERIETDVNNRKHFFETPSLVGGLKIVYLDQMVNLSNIIDIKFKIKEYFKDINTIMIEYQPVNMIHYFVTKLIDIFKVMDFSFKCVDGLIYINLELVSKSIRKNFFDRITAKDYYANYYRLYSNIVFDYLLSSKLRTVRVCDGESLDIIPFLDEIKRLKLYPIEDSVGKPLASTKAHYKINELNEDFDYMLCKVLPNATVLDLCSGPGTWSKYITDNNPKVFNNTVMSSKIISCSFKNNGKMSDNFEHFNKVNYENIEHDFDMTSTESVENFISFVQNNKTKLGVELVVADGGLDGSYVDQEIRSLEIIKNEIKIALSVLANGGRFVLKLYFGETSESTQLVAVLQKFFENSFLIKPSFSNLASAEIYFIGINYNNKVFNDVDISNVLNRGYWVGVENYLYQFNYNRYVYMKNNIIKDLKFTPVIIPLEDSNPEEPNSETETLNDNSQVVDGEVEIQLNKKEEKIENNVEEKSKEIKTEKETVTPVRPPRIKKEKKKCLSLESTLESLKVDVRKEQFIPIKTKKPPIKPPRTFMKRNSIEDIVAVPELPPRVPLTTNLKHRSDINFVLPLPKTEQTKSHYEDFVPIKPALNNVHQKLINDKVKLEAIDKLLSREAEKFVSLMKNRNKHLSLWDINHHKKLRGSFSVMSECDNVSIIENMLQEEILVNSVESSFSEIGVFISSDTDYDFSESKVEFISENLSSKQNLLIENAEVGTVSKLEECENSGSESEYVSVTTEEVLNNFTLKLSNDIIKFQTNYIIPNLRVLITPTDGNCLFYAMSLCLSSVNYIKEKIKKNLKNSYVFNQLPETQKKEVLEILNNNNRWGTTDIIDLYCECFNVCIFELHFNGLVIVHGNFVNLNSTYFVYYENSHFSAAIPVNIIYASHFISPELSCINNYIEYLGENTPVVGPFAYISNNFSGFALLHISSLNESIIPSQRIVSVRSLVSAIPYLLVEISSENRNQSADLHGFLNNHWKTCTNCSTGKLGNWFHHLSDHRILLSCSERKSSRVIEDVSICDLILAPYEERTPLNNNVLRSRLEGKILHIALPYSDMSTDAFYLLIKNTIEMYRIFPCNTVALSGNLSINKMKFYNVIFELFGSVYHQPFKMEDDRGYEFKFDVMMGNTKEAIMMNAANEIRAAYKVTISKVTQNCHQFYTQLKAMTSITKSLKFTDTSVNVLYVDTGKWAFNTYKTYRFAYGFSEGSGVGKLIGLNEFYSKQTEVRLEFLQAMKQKGYAFLIVYKGTEVLLEPPLYTILSNKFIFETILRAFDIEIIRGVPGAGKTSFILNRHKVSNDLNELILTATKNAALDLRERVRKMYPSIKFAKNVLNYKYATLESVLLHPERYMEPVDVIYFDEAYLKHLGSCVWTALLIKAKRLVFVGDEAQVPYSDRNDLPLNFSNVKLLMQCIPSENKQFLRISHRIPRDAATMINTFLKIDGKPMYEAPILTTNTIERSIGCIKISGIVNIPQNYDHYLVFTQDEKQEMERKGYRCNTIHEFQGQQRSKIAIVRLKSVSNRIYDNVNHILTAFSRHTNECMYFSVVDDGICVIIRSLLRSVIDPAVVSGGGYVYNSARTKTAIENRINPRLNGIDMSPDKQLELIPDYCVNLNEEDSTLVSIVMGNDCNGFRGHYIVAVDKPVIKIPRVDVLSVQKTYDNVNILQYYFDLFRPGASMVPNRYLMDVFENSDIMVTSRNFSLGQIKTLPSKYDTLTPKLRTSCPIKFYNSQKAFLKAYNERNGAVDSAETAVKDPLVLETSIEKFFSCYFKKNSKILINMFSKSPITVNVDSLTKWLNTQPPGVFEELKAVESKYLIDHLTHKYSYMLKSVAKPKLEPNPECEFASPQAIAYLPKIVNAVFCPIVQELKKRIQYLLKDDKLLFTDMSVEVLEDVLTERVPRSKLMQIKRKYEIDFSKYDRSQRLWTLDFETEIMKKFGVSSALIEFWIVTHKLSILIAHDVRFKALVEYQRKSGDAMTYLGNTLWLMYILMNIIGEEIMTDAFAMFGGDDSLVLVSNTDRELDFTKVFNKSQALFNMEMKIIDVNSFYFCSRFIVFCPIDERWYVVPDPLKALIKLGRHDLVNHQHAKEYMISLRDNWSNYGNVLLHNQINYNFCDRYKFNVDISLLLSAMYNLVNHEEEFLGLYYWFDNDEECQFSLLPSLEM